MSERRNIFRMKMILIILNYSNTGPFVRKGQIDWIKQDCSLEFERKDCVLSRLVQANGFSCV